MSSTSFCSCRLHECDDVVIQNVLLYFCIWLSYSFRFKNGLQSKTEHVLNFGNDYICCCSVNLTFGLWNSYRKRFVHKSLKQNKSNKYIRSTDLDRFSRLQRLLRRNPHLSFPQQLLGEVGDVSTGDGDVLDAAADDIAFSLEHEHVKFCENEEGAGQQSLKKN